MGDVFLEQLVKKRDMMPDILKKCAILFTGLLCLFGSVVFFLASRYLAPISLLLVAGSIYFTWYFISGLNLEFEYIYTNGEIDVDKISAKRKRKRLTTVRVSSFEEFEKFDPEKFRTQKYDVVNNASICLIDESNYYAVYRNHDGQKCILIFSPNQRLLDAIRTQIRRRPYGANA